MVELLAAQRPPFRLLTSDAVRAFAAVKLADLDGSAVQTLTGAWTVQGASRYPGKRSLHVDQNRVSGMRSG
ncbi:hypothetical protein [Nocardia sp. NPDC051463]|uniref:hypothetical protein n=1 Tax=Nocardia sp. NPDC051463 TaxID=3154845 RepID=UPI003413B68F